MVEIYDEDGGLTGGGVLPTNHSAVPTTKNDRLSAALSSAVAAQRTNTNNRTVVPAGSTCSYFFSVSLWKGKG